MRTSRCTDLTELNLQVKRDSDMDLDQGSHFLSVSQASDGRSRSLVVGGVIMSINGDQH